MHDSDVDPLLSKVSAVAGIRRRFKFGDQCFDAHDFRLSNSKSTPYDCLIGTMHIECKRPIGEGRILVQLENKLGGEFERFRVFTNWSKVTVKEIAGAVASDEEVRQILREQDVVTVCQTNVMDGINVFGTSAFVKETVIFIGRRNPYLFFERVAAAMYPLIADIFGQSLDIRHDGRGVIQFRRSQRGNTRALLHGHSTKGILPPLSSKAFMRSPLVRRMIRQANHVCVIPQSDDASPFADFIIHKWVTGDDPSVTAVFANEGEVETWNNRIRKANVMVR